MNQQHPSRDVLVLGTQRGKHMTIKGLRPRFSILGHIKAGGRKKLKNGNTIPEKWDHFGVTTAQRGDLNYEYDDTLMQKLLRSQLEMAIKDATEQVYDEQGKLEGSRLLIPMKRLEEENRKLRRMIVFLPFDDANENLLTTLAVYDGSGCRCRGDGESAEYIDPSNGKVEKLQCPCQMLRIALEDTRVDDRPAHPRLSPNPQRGEVCKAHGLLRVMVAEAKTMGGVHVYRTTSSNSIRQLMASMAHIQELTGGALSYVPLELSIEPKKVKPEGSRGYQTVYVVHLTYRAAPLEFLKDVASQVQLRASMRQRIAAHEIAALPAPGHEDHDEQVAVAEEYLSTGEPEDAIDSEGEVVDRDTEKPRERTSSKGATEAPASKPPKEKEAQKPSEPPRGTIADTDEQRAHVENLKKLKAKKEAKEKAEREAKEKAERTSAEEPPPPTDADAPDPTPEPEKQRRESAPQDAEKPRTDDKGLPVIVNAEPAAADKAAASKDLRKAFIRAGHEAGFTDLELREWIKRLWDVESTAKLASWQVTAMTEPLTRMQGRSA